MAYLIHSINIAVGGSCHHADTVADEEHHRYARDLLARADGLLLGRQTFELFEAFWPNAMHGNDVSASVAGLASELTAKPKYVVTSRPLESGWANTDVLPGPGLGAVRAFLDGASGTIVVFGSPRLGASLMAAGLVQELHVVLQPFVGAATMRAFEGLDGRRRLALLEARPFRSGVVLLRYAVAA